MRIHLVTTYYAPFVQNFLKRNPDIERISYAEMLDQILAEFFADTGSAYYWLKKNGQEVFITITNFEPLQKKWAKENLVAFDENNREEIILLEQVKFFKADVFYTESINVHSENLIKEVASHVKLMAAWISFPFDHLPTAKYFDLILTSTKDYKKKFIKQGIASEYMLPAFDTRVSEKLGEIKKVIDLSFVGGISSVHKNRWDALNYLCKHTDIKIWGYGMPAAEPDPIKRLFKKDPYSVIRKHHQGEAWGLEMYKILGASYVTFNIHEDLLKGDVGNMRMFEATGIGTMILNDHGNNINELFEPNKEIVTYRSLPEALEKYNYYITHKEKAVEIGENAKRKTRDFYNYHNYALSLVDFLKKYIH